MKVILLVLLPLITFTQDVPIGYWKDYLSYNEPKEVTIANERVYCVASGGLFYYNTNDNSINRVSKVNGLSDNEVEKIKFNNYNNTLVITYKNCNIDFLKDDVIINISDIKRKEITGKKKINNIDFENNLAYISCTFGVVVLNMTKNEVKDTYKIGDNAQYVEINQTEITEDLIYVATSEGLYSASKNNLFLSDYNQWEKETLFNNVLLQDASFSGITSFNNTVVAVLDKETDSVLIKHNTWENTLSLGFKRPKLSKSGESLVITDSNQIIIISTNLQQVKIETVNNAFNSASKLENEIWVADKNLGLLRYLDQEIKESITVNSPISNDIYSLEYYLNKLFICHGGHINFSLNKLNNDGASVMENYNWYNKDFFDLNRARDIVSVASFNGKEFYASWYNGISVMEDDEHIIKYGFQNTNGVLDTTFYSNNRIQISDIKFDNNNNMWGLNSQVERPLFVKKADDSWYSFGMNQDINGLYFDELIIDQENKKWGVIVNGGIFVYTDNNTISNFSDDSYKILNTNIGNGNLPSQNVLAISEDLDGEIWIGTDKGVAVFYYPELVFSGYNFDAQQILIQEGDYGQYLLSTEKINCITIDGANRKWIGTEAAGLYLLSEDGIEQIHHFTKTNSPLFSDKIVDITINNQNGEVFIGTDKGLISYRSDATKGEENQGTTYVFPNPVRENYRGNIAINKLVNNAQVKITDISGNLIFQTTAQGGQANWNGLNFNNQRVGTGIYLVFSTDEQGFEKMTSKILFIK
ncbi:MAG: T9SS type A sorting domain-containing protein [Flavobacteriales bacterium]|jgi:hypothetical protein|nr:T9SS type A sorting domain-containing protein [Flavobacteriales bacterium]